MKKQSTNKITRFITLPKISDEGYLSFAENGRHLPFNMKRFYFIYDVYNNAKRGFHAHKKNKQALFCIKGQIKIILDDGKKREEVILDQPNIGIYINRFVWHEMHDFTNETVLFVAASEVFNESDYIRNYAVFLDLVNNSFLSRIYSFLKSIFAQNIFHNKTNL